MRFRIDYREPRELVTEHDQQFVRGGVLVRCTPPAGIALFEDVELALHCGAAPALITRAQIVQIVPGAGVAVAFTVAAVPGLIDAVARARAAGAGPWPAASSAPIPVPVPVSVPVPAPAPAPASAAPVGAAARWNSATNNEKIQIALHGNRDERNLVLRDINKTLHPYVLRNPNLQLDEVAAMAKMNTISPEVLKQIADRREWIARPDIAISLVRNPKVPTPIAVKLLDHVSPSDLRQLAKDTRTREAVQQAARKKIIK